MNPQQESANKKQSDSKEKKEIKSSQKTETPKSSKTKSTSTPKDNKKNSISVSNEPENCKNLGLTFSQIYDYHIKVIEEKTNLKINQIYWFLSISLFFFMIGHFERIFSYIITLYFPIIWTKEDYFAKKKEFWKKMGNLLDSIFCFNFFRYT